MYMVPFYTRFRDLAFNEMRTVIVHGYETLPDGEYGFLELYCDDVDCDCRRVVINVVTPNTGAKVWATINYGWESRAFYVKWLGSERDVDECMGPVIDFLNEQTVYSYELLELFKYALRDTAYITRLKRHYKMFKASLRIEKPARRLRLKKKR